MNSTATRRFVATLLIALIAAFALMTGLSRPAAESASQPAAQIVKLERVVITGKRAESAQLAQSDIKQLPRVVIEGRRMNADVQLAALKPQCNAQAQC